MGVFFVLIVNFFLHAATGRLVRAQDKKLIEQREDYVRMQNNILANRIIHEGIDEFSISGDFSEDSDMISELQVMASGLEGRIILLGSNFKVVSDTYERNIEQYIITEDTLKAMKGESVKAKRVGNSYVQVVTGIIDKETDQSKGVVITLASLQDEKGALSYIKSHSVVINGLFFLFSLILGSILTIFSRR